MKRMLKKFKVWWVNIQIDMAKAEMCAWFEKGELRQAHIAKDRFYSLIAQRNALEVQP